MANPATTLLGHTDQATPQPVSLLEKLDPRTRILSVLVFSAVTVSLSSLLVLSLCLATSLTLLLISRQPLRPTLKRMAAMDGFILFMLVLLPFTIPGTTLFTVLSSSFSAEGLHKATQIALRANATILALLILVGTLEPVTFGHALRRIKTPENLVHLMMFTLRYISILHEEYTKLRDAMKMRGFRPANSLHTYRSLGYLVGMMLIRSIDRSERILGAMKCRGFTGKIHLLSTMAFTRADTFFAAASFTLFCAFVYMDAAL